MPPHVITSDLGRGAGDQPDSKMLCENKFPPLREFWGRKGKGRYLPGHLTLDAHWVLVSGMLAWQRFPLWGKLLLGTPKSTLGWYGMVMGTTAMGVHGFPHPEKYREGCLRAFQPLSSNSSY